MFFVSDPMIWMLAHCLHVSVLASLCRGKNVTGPVVSRGMWRALKPVHQRKLDSLVLVTDNHEAA